MAFRERIKKALRKASPSSSLSKSSSKENTKDRERWPSNVYKPGEPMPRPKYRAPVKKEHKEKLESFSFASAWRRMSFVSEYSPMGTRMPSRRPSLISRKSFGARSSMSKSRRNSVAGAAAGTRSARESFDNGRERHAALAPALSTEVEADGDDDVTNGQSSAQFIMEEESANTFTQSASLAYNQGKTNRENPSTRVVKQPNSDQEPQHNHPTLQ